MVERGLTGEEMSPDTVSAAGFIDGVGRVDTMAVHLITHVMTAGAN